MPLDDSPSINRSVLLTGANGFIGAQVMRALADRDVDVIAVLRPGSHAMPLAASRPDHFASFVKHAECDLLNAKSVEAMIATHRPSACIHCAWDVARPDYLAHADNQKWVQASLHLARNLKANGCGWMGVIGTHIEPLGATPPPNRYAAAKATLRNRLIDLAGRDMTVCWWRLFQPYGEGERESRFIPSLLNSISRGVRFLVKQPEAQRDFIHVEDAADAIAASFEHSLGGVFDLGSGHQHRLHEVASRAARLLNAEHLLEFSPLEFTTPEIVRPADIAPLCELAGWSPRIDLDAGLHALASAVRAPLRATA